MEYVEYLRDRRILRNYAIVLLAGFVLGMASLISGTHGTIRIQGTSHRGTIDVSGVLAACSFLTFIIATVVAPGLAAQVSTLAIAWTRPLSRAAVAWRFIVVDLAAIVTAYLMVLATVLLFVAVFHSLVTVQLQDTGSAASLNDLMSVRFDAPQMVAVAARGFGCTLMWYGLVTLVSVRFPERCGMIAGLSWVAFLVLGGLWNASFPPLIHGLIVALNYLNPIAYFGNFGSDVQQQIIPLSGTLRTLIAWCIGIAALAGTIRLWSTREV
ncbi:MAG TPA: hypothetical protein VMA36_20785 [Candidatus Limnocylindria bacterium]|jgi:hypothetical protein|nr:hypothetical protein [Candidatus Limnocylindria bacterium]